MKRIILKTSLILVLSLGINACSETPAPLSKMKLGPKGNPGEHTAIPINTEGNIFGYMEYLPLKLESNDNKKIPLIFYWNGKNAISGDGNTKLYRSLSQGLPLLIHGGRNFDAIIISAMLPENSWKTIDTSVFVDYVLERYNDQIDTAKIYMTGFSAGGGITVRYATENPSTLAAIVPIAPAVPFPENETQIQALSMTPTWFFHNDGDPTVKLEHSLKWSDPLRKIEPDMHKITIINHDSHYAWQSAYNNNEMWEWLFSQSKSFE